MFGCTSIETISISRVEAHDGDVVRQVGGEELHHHPPVVRELGGEVQSAHPAAAELVLDAVGITQRVLQLGHEVDHARAA